MKNITLLLILALAIFGTAQVPGIPFCTSAPSGTCVSCSTGYYLGGVNTTCIPVPAANQCQTYNMNTGNCLTCWANNYYIASSGACTPVSSLCATWDQVTGWCLSCWSSANQVNSVGQCVPSPVSNLNCATLNAAGTACSSCWSTSSYINTLGACVAGSGNCATYTNTGLCASCWSSSSVVNAAGACVAAPASNLNCATLNAAGTACLSCWSASSYINAGGACVSGNGGCASYANITGLCASCWGAYYVNTLGACAQVSPTCATWNPDGTCVTCWIGTPSLSTNLFTCA